MPDESFECISPSTTLGKLDGIVSGVAGGAKLPLPFRIAAGAQHALVAQVSQRVRFDVLADLLHRMAGSNQLSFVGSVHTVIAGEIVGGQLMRIWTSVAPAARTILTIFRLVVPRTIESSTSTTRLPTQ